MQTLITKLKSQPDTISFDEVMELISQHYDYTPTDFTNGIGDDQVINAAGTNEGSCKIFAFSQLNGLSEVETLACFGKYYREDVLGNPEGHDHANIRTFMRHGWPGIHFEKMPLTAK